MTDKPPSIFEELNRKSLEALRWLVEQHRDGYISDAELHTARTTLFMTVAGLARPDVVELLTQGALPPEQKDTTIRLLRSGDTLVLLKHAIGDHGVEVATLKSKSPLSTRTTSFKGDDAPRKARLWLKKALKALVENQGFQPL